MMDRIKQAKTEQDLLELADLILPPENYPFLNADLKAQPEGFYIDLRVRIEIERKKQAEALAAKLAKFRGLRG